MVDEHLIKLETISILVFDGAWGLHAYTYVSAHTDFLIGKIVHTKTLLS